jgi:peptidoglycan-N-acetylglucosamine deacetylase
MIRRVVERLTAAPVVRVATDEPYVALTFDDGPHPVDTPMILDVLAAHGVRATFFVLADAAHAHPDLIARLRGAGHQVAWHGAIHRSAVFDPAVRGWRAQWRQLPSAGAVEPRPGWYRPPYGHEGRRSRAVALASNSRLVGWSAAPNDWRGDDAITLAHRLGKALRPGAVVLLHDTLRTAVDVAAFDRAPLRDALELVLAADHLYQFVTLDELVGLGRPVRRVRLERGRPLPALIERPLS